MVCEILNSQILVSLSITDVPRCTSSSAKTVGLNHLQLSAMGTGSGPPEWASVVHFGTDELLVKQDTVPDRETTPPVQDRPQHSQPLGSFLHDVTRSGQPCI